VDVEQSAAISGADAAGMSRPKLDEVTVWLPGQADPVCVECDGQGVKAWFKGKTPKPCLPWLLAVRTGRAAKSCPLMGKVGHENGNSLCHKAGPDWLTARLRFVPQRFHAALRWTGVAGVTAAAAPEAAASEEESELDELEENLAEDLFWDNGLQSEQEKEHLFWLAGPRDDEEWSADAMLKVKQAQRSEQILVGGPGEDEVWPETDMRQVLLARQRLERQQKLDRSLDEIIQASRSAEADAVKSDGDDDQIDRRAAHGRQGAAAQHTSNQDGTLRGRGSWGPL
jgi:hypothetical protein